MVLWWLVELVFIRYDVDDGSKESQDDRYLYVIKRNKSKFHKHPARMEQAWHGLVEGHYVELRFN